MKGTTRSGREGFACSRARRLIFIFPSQTLEECPICFLHYPALNTSDCCTQRICTECILKVRALQVSEETSSGLIISLI
jgi:hypothetical protein